MRSAISIVAVMLAFLLFLTKPFLYVAAYDRLSAVARSYGADPPGSKLRGFGRVAVAATVRVLFGLLAMAIVTGLSPVMGDGGVGGAFTGIVVLGFLSWAAVGHVFYRQVPVAKLLIFALIAEAISGAIDYWALLEVSTIHFC